MFLVSRRERREKKPFSCMKLSYFWAILIAAPISKSEIIGCSYYKL